MTLWETIGKVVLKCELRENRFQISSMCLEAFFVPWLCTLTYGHMLNWEPVALKLFYKLRLFNKVIAKKYKGGGAEGLWVKQPHKTRNWQPVHIAKPCLSAWNIGQVREHRLTKTQQQQESS